MAAGGWIDAVDFGTLRKLPADHVGDHGQQRRGDAVWRVGFQDRWLYLLILLEFQSSVDVRMALRILEYTALLYRELDRQNELEEKGEENMSLADRVAEWPKAWLEQGRREGLEQGLEQGLQQERALLRHLAGLRFGSAVARRIAPSLARIGDAERFTGAAELIVSAPTGDELIERLAALAGPAASA